MEEMVSAQLRALGRERAPATLAPAVLLRLGLADGYWLEEGPTGSLFIAYNDRGISAVVPASRGAAAFERAFRQRFGRRACALESPPAHLEAAVARRLAGDRRVKLRFDLRGTSEFGRAVLEKALEIPRGEVRPYGWVAREIGRPKAVRAVGTALGGNPVPLLIPCHRVVRGDGAAGEYALGSAMKRRLLQAEGVDGAALEQRARGGRRYVGSGTTHVFCHPTCAQARRITERHRIDFADERAALAAGYRPCKRCRPALAS